MTDPKVFNKADFWSNIIINYASKETKFFANASGFTIFKVSSKHANKTEKALVVYNHYKTNSVKIIALPSCYPVY